ncbi:hypothetical protein GXW82_23750 [Streptacidiphilus sp. 4-A2]|nr:hypothetical protein [Streptacidiphilus sp. 4-A2]
MNIPAYAHAIVRSALPAVPTSRQVSGLECCLCKEAFGGQAAIALSPTSTSGLFGCRSCLTRLVAQARRARDQSLTQNAERARTEAAEWQVLQDHYLATLDGVRLAAEAVARLALDGDGVEPLKVAWLSIALESAHSWAKHESPGRPESIVPDESPVHDAEFQLDLEMISAREAVADRLAYHVVNSATPAEPEMCEEFECPQDCSGQHDFFDIDCGPDQVFDDLAECGIVVERPDPAPAHAVRLRRLVDANIPKESRSRASGRDLVDVLARFGIDADDSDSLVCAAAVGLVTEAWLDEPLDEIRAARKGPSAGEVLAQSVDLYRIARESFMAAKNAGPEALLGFQAIAADVTLPWAGGSRFTLRSTGEPTADFVQNVDNRVWYTSKLMQEHGWREAVLQRAAAAAYMASDHFGMPGWRALVSSTMQKLGSLDRSSAPQALQDLADVEEKLREAPDQLGVAALDWLFDQGLLD